MSDQINEYRQIKEEDVGNFSSNKKDSKGLFIVLSIVLCFVTGFLVLYFVFQNSQLKKQLSVLRNTSIAMPSMVPSLILWQNDPNSDDCTTNQEGWCTLIVEKPEESNYFDYQLIYPTDWTLKMVGEYVKTVKLSKGPLLISIEQVIVGGGACLYVGDSSFDGPQAPLFREYIDLNRKDKYDWRLSSSEKDEPTLYVVCSKLKSEKLFGLPVNIGDVTVRTTEKSFTDSQIKEVSEILEKIEVID